MSGASRIHLIHIAEPFSARRAAAVARSPRGGLLWSQLWLTTTGPRHRNGEIE